MSKRIKIGDLIEFKSSYGKIRYAQITHNQKDYGYLLTLFKTEYDHQVDDLSNLLTDEVQFRVFFLLQNAIKQSLVTKLENFEVRDDLKGLPRFKGLKPLQFTSGKYEWAIWEDGVTVKPYNAKISIDEKNIQCFILLIMKLLFIKSILVGETVICLTKTMNMALVKIGDGKIKNIPNHFGKDYSQLVSERQELL